MLCEKFLTNLISIWSEEHQDKTNTHIKGLGTRFVMLYVCTIGASLSSVENLGQTQQGIDVGCEDDESFNQLDISIVYSQEHLKCALIFCEE
jgi:hypothetical protein